jgi:hypothetical protein
VNLVCPPPPPPLTLGRELQGFPSLNYKLVKASSTDLKDLACHPFSLVELDPIAGGGGGVNTVVKEHRVNEHRCKVALNTSVADPGHFGTAPYQGIRACD